MPQIPEFPVDHSAFEGGQVNPGGFAAPGMALAQAGTGVTDQMQQVATQYAEARRATLATNLTFGAMSQMQDAADKWRNTPDAAAASQGFMADAGQIKSQTLQGLDDPVLQRYVTDRLSEHALTLERQTSFAALGLENAKRRGDLLGQLDTQATQAGTATDPAVRASYVTAAHAAISGAIAAGWLHGDEGAQIGKRFDTQLGSAGLLTDAARDPIGTAAAYAAGKYDNLLDFEAKERIAPRLGAVIGKAIGAQTVPSASGGQLASPGAAAPDDPRGMIPVIRSAAAKYGVDPDVAVKVAQSEGLANFTGDGGTSFAAFQLHVGGGLGDQFRQETRLDPSDPKNEPATIDFALRHVAETGWSPYHGAARVGVSDRQGIGTGSGDPSLAGMYDKIDSLGLDPMATLAAKQTARVQYDATEADQARQQRIQAVAQAQASRGAENDIIADAYSATPKITAAQVADDPRLTPDAKMRMIGVVRRGDDAGPAPGASHMAALGLINRIRAPDGDPAKITDDAPIYDALTGNQLSKADFDFVKQQFDQIRTPGGEIFAKREADFLRSVESQISPKGLLGQLDPAGAERFYQFQWQLGKKTGEYRKAGKDPVDLLDPSKPDYMGKPEALKAFTQPIALRLEDVPPPHDTPPAVQGPPAAAIDYLKSHQQLRDQFEAKYGAGAAVPILGPDISPPMAGSSLSAKQLSQLQELMATPEPASVPGEEYDDLMC